MSKLLLVSNYFNAHQLGLASHLNRLLSDDFHFVSLNNQMNLVGRPSLDSEYCYVLKEYAKNDKNQIRRHILEDDMVVFGDVGAREDLVFLRELVGRPYLRYTERPFKAASDRAILNKMKTAVRFSRFRQGMHVLCAGAYVADDLSELGFPRDRCFSWGYFPQLEGCERRPCECGTKAQMNLIWVGRFIDWKRPGWVVRLAGELRDRCVPFRITMIGDGPLFDNVRAELSDNGLSSLVRLTGELPFQDVLEEMKKSDIYLMTSNHQEGWGVSLNEAMYAWCAPVADRSAGAVPFLIQDGVNGMSYKADSYEDFRDCILDYADNRSLIPVHAAKAHLTVDIKGPWGSEMAARSLIELVEAMLMDRNIPSYSGRCCQRLDDFPNGLGRC